MDIETDNQPEAIMATARSIQEFAKEQMDVELSFDGESVKWLDGYIEKIRKQYDAASTANLIAAFGAYFGEALIHNYGGEWQQYKGTWCVSIDEDHKAFPFAKVAKQFENGSADSIYQFFIMVPIVMKLGPDPDSKQANPPE